MVSIPIYPQVITHDPDAISLTGDQNVPTTARYVLTVTQDTSGHTLTVPNQQSHMIVNTGSYSFNVASTGNGSTSVAVGSVLTVLWDVDTTAHVLVTQSGGSSLPVTDTTAIAKGSADETKQVRLELDGQTTAVTGVLATSFTTAKTLTFPDATDTLVGRDTTDTLTNKTINTASNTITVLEADISDLQSYLLNIVEDTTPQLGGALDGQGNDLNNLGVAFFTEQAAAEADVAGKGQVWVQTATPNLLMFTDDAGSDFQVATTSGTETLTNKTLNLTSNTLSMTMAQLDAAISDGNAAYATGAFHDGFSDYVANEHIDHSAVTITIAGTTNQLVVAEGAQSIAASRTYTISMAGDLAMPGTGAFTVVKGTTAQQPSGTNGQIRYDTTTNKFRAYQNGSWQDMISGSGNQQYIYLIRNNSIVTDYAEGYTSSADFGTQLDAAITALTSGDTLLVGPGEYQFDGYVVATSDVRLIFVGATLIPNGNYEKIFVVNADDVTIEGLKIDGGETMNTGAGVGIQIGDATTPNRVTLINCESSGVRGTSDAADGIGLKIFGDDTRIYGFVSRSPGYCGIIVNANRCSIEGAYVTNPVNRALNYEGSSARDWFRLSNSLFVADTAGKLIGMNFNSSAETDTVHVSGVSITQAVNANTGSREQNAKFQNITNLILENCSFRHGTNDGAGFSTGLAFDSSIEKIVFRDCTFSDGFVWGGYRHDDFLIEGCSFGVDQCENAVMSWDVSSKNFTVRNCRFNLNTSQATRIFTFPAGWAAGDRFTFVDNVAVANNGSNVGIANSNLNNDPQSMVIYGNQLTNSGAGDFLMSTDAATRRTMLASRRNLTKTQAINVRDMGATGDGTTDDTTAVTDALTVAQALSVPLYFPAGTYLITTGLTLATKDILYGDGRNRSIIKTASAITVITLANECELRDIQIHGSDTASSKGAKDLNPGPIRWQMERVWFNHLDIGLEIEHSIIASMQDCYFRNNINAGIKVIDVAGGTINAVYVLGGEIQANDIGVWIEGDTDNFDFYGCVIEGNSLYGVQMTSPTGNTIRTSFYGCWFEQNGDHHISCDAGWFESTLSGNKFSDGSQPIEIWPKGGEEASGIKIENNFFSSNGSFPNDIELNGGAKLIKIRNNTKGSGDEGNVTVSDTSNDRTTIEHLASQWERHLSVSTTDATVTTLATIATTTDTCYHIVADIVAVNTTTYAEGASYQIRATYRNAGDTVSAIGSPDIYTAEDTSGWDATTDISGTSVRVRITGAAATNITWKGHVRVMPVS